ncbi:MAG TPA: DEAD/DEAH box helicase [Xanthobacteraceae bacterium]|nr:DEAD/DEAH box helicase [Xanthobacteraceae bacterium]
MVDSLALRDSDGDLLAAAVARAWRDAPAPTYGKLAFDPVQKRWIMTGIAPHVAIRLKRSFPRVPKTETAAFTFPATDEACTDLAWFMQRYPLEMSAIDRARLERGCLAFDRDRAAVERVLGADWQPTATMGFREGFVPHPNQARAIEVARLRRRLLLMDDVGLGKTESALGTIAAADSLPAAIVVQPHLATQWAQRCKLRTHLRPHVIEVTRPYPLPEADVYIFRYSNVHGWVDVAATGKFRSVVYDEIQELRHGGLTEKGKACAVFSEHAELRLGLSATPIYNQGAEIWDVMQFIEPGALGSYNEFLREWCGVKGVVTEPEALGTYLREQHLVLREVRSGRPVNTIVREVPYDEKVEAQSAALARQLALTVMRGTFVERGQAARELDLLLRQITGVAKAKHVAAFVRLLLEAGTPVVLAGWHREVYDIWLEELAEFKPVMYTGSETTKHKDEAKRAFCAGETDLFIISLRSGSGLDGLQQRCSTVVIGELDWSPQVHAQLIGRVDRPGQTAEECTAIYLHADGGSDPLMVSLLGLKASQSAGIVDPLRGVATVYSDESRIRQLAEAYLSRAA